MHRGLLAELLNYTMTNFKNFLNEASVEDIQKWYEAVDASFSIDDIDSHLLYAMQNESHEIIISLLRYTYPLKAQLPSWYFCLNKTKNLLVKHNMNCDYMLMGLETPLIPQRQQSDDIMLIVIIIVMIVMGFIFW